jgi:hypothetical protein
MDIIVPVNFTSFLLRASTWLLSRNVPLALFVDAKQRDACAAYITEE